MHILGLQIIAYSYIIVRIKLVLLNS